MNIITIHILLSTVFIQINKIKAFRCHEDEINSDNWCYKLTSLNFENDLEKCEAHFASSNSTAYFTCLKNLLNRIFRIYTENASLNDHNYEFAFLDLNKNDHILRKLLHATHEPLRPNTTINIFFNYYSYNFHGYIENESKNDEIPNLMMHPEDALKNLTQVCIIGQQIQRNNESFKFKFSECGKTYPFICVKPLKKATTLGDRCSSFRENLPGGNWIECDKRVNGIISESQMCCMYNVNLNENFDNANSYCSRFDARIFSSKIIGYKSILEYYAAYLNVNYGKSENFDYANFWTSCQSNSTTVAHSSTTCLDNKEDEKQVSFDFSIGTSALEIVSLQVWTNVSKAFIRYNLTNIFRLIDVHAKFKMNTSQFGQINYANACENILNVESVQSSDHLAQIKCLRKLFEFIIKDSFFLFRRNVKMEKLKLDMVRTRRKRSEASESKCFSFYQENDKLIYLSLPLLNKCFHLTLSSFSKNGSDLRRLRLENRYLPYLQSNFSNADLPLNELRIEILYSIFDILGITEVDCNLNNGSRVFSVGKITDTLNASSKIKSCSEKSETSTFLEITNTNELNKKTSDWRGSVNAFIKQSNILIDLHSYSFYKKILHLSCFDSFLRAKIEVLFEK